MVLPGRFSQGTPAWYDNPTMPSFEDYADDPAGYDAAVSAWVAAQNGGPAGTAPGYDPVTGMNYAGSQRMADMSQGEYAANYLNSRIQSAANQVANGNPDHPNAKMLQLALSNRASIRPEEFQSAYQAATQGTAGPSPILSDTALNFLESLGYGPPPPPTQPGQLPPTMRPRPQPGPQPGQPLVPGNNMTNVGIGPPPPGYHYEGDILVRDGATVDTTVTSGHWGGDNPLMNQVPLPPTMRPGPGAPATPTWDGFGHSDGSLPGQYLSGNPDVRSRFEQFKRARQGQTPPYLPVGLAGY